MEAAGLFETLKFYQTVRGHILADSIHINYRWNLRYRKFMIMMMIMAVMVMIMMVMV